jgi:hypothetical protein
MPRYEGHIACLKEDGKAEVIIEQDNTGVPGVSPQINRRVCHCATDSSIIKIEALNRAGAGVGDRVFVSLETSGLIMNAIVLLGIPEVCIMIGIALAYILIHGFAFPMIDGIVVAAGFLLLGIALGVSMFRRVSVENPPVIDRIIKTRFEAASMYEEDAFPMQSDNRGCDGCPGPFS